MTAVPKRAGLVGFLEEPGLSAFLGRDAGDYFVVGWLAFWVLIVYGRVLSFPFFSDDFFQLPFLDAHRFSELWQTAEGLFFFRPFAFSVWKGWFWLFGAYQPAAFHALNLLLHWLNCVLLYWLTAKLWPERNGRLKAGMTATLFALFPFSYEAVAWVAAVMHPLFLTLTLLSVVAFLQMRGSKRPNVWLIVGLLGALLSPFAHENGVLTGPLVWIVALTRPKGGKLKRAEIFRAGLWVVPLLVWFVVWQQVPARDGSGGLALNDLETMLQNGLYFLQGLGYPLSWLGGLVRDYTGLNSTAATLVSSAPGVIILLVVRWRLGLNRQGFLPWLWTAVSVAPPIMFLPNLHVIAAPRMFMLPAVSIAWLWTEAFWYFYVGRRERSTISMGVPRHYRLGIAMALLVALVLQNMAFIRTQLDLYHIGGTAISEIGAAAVEADEEGRPLVFINIPSWIAPLQATYATGQEGDNLILGADMVEPLIWAQTGEQVEATAVRYDDIRVEEMPYYTGPVGQGPDWNNLLAEEAAVFVTDYAPEQIDIKPAGVLGIPASDERPLAEFGGLALLLGATAETEGDQIQLDLTWQVVGQVPFEYTVFVHGLDENGMLVGQADGDPLAGTFSMGLWPVGTIVQDTRFVSSGKVRSFLIGLYSQLDGMRLMAFSAEGEPLPDKAFPFGG
jgi:hypothetical protein